MNLKSTIGTALAVMMMGTVALAEDLPVDQIESKDMATQTVTIDNHQYEVTGETRILDLAGNPMTLAQVKTLADNDMPPVSMDECTFAYDAKGSVLDLLQQTVMPR